MRKRDGHGHQFLGFIAGVAEHHALVARADVVALAAAALFQRVVDAHGDIGRLLIQHDLHRAGARVKTARAVLIADARDGIADNLVVIHLRLGGDFAHHQHHAGGGDGFARHARHGILRKMRVQNRVRNLVADLIGMTLRNRFRSKESRSFLQHFFLHPFSLFS